MYHKVTLKQCPEVKAVILAAFPGYRKHDAYLDPCTDVSLWGTYWDGGSRREYCAVELATKRSQGAPQYAPAQFGGPVTSPVVSIPLGVVIVAGGVSCGKPATATVYIHPDNLAPLLPAPAMPAPPLTPEDMMRRAQSIPGYQAP